MGKRNPCRSCDKGGTACGDCFYNTQNGAPRKLYTPKGAARAMLAGKVLKGQGDREFFFGKYGEETSFWCREKSGFTHLAGDFAYLWEEL
jgi:hypothetical protein